MRKLILLLAVFQTLLFGVENIEFYAKSMNSIGSKVIAEEEVFVVYEESYMSADKAIYDKNSSD